LLETVLSNCTFDRGTLCPTYSKPFDLLIRGNETRDWLGGREHSVDAALKVYDALEEAFELLAERPGIGHLREDLTNRRLKFSTVYSYLVV
jgi:hypothetical protein